MDLFPTLAAARPEWRAPKDWANNPRDDDELQATPSSSVPLRVFQKTYSINV